MTWRNEDIVLYLTLFFEQCAINPCKLSVTLRRREFFCVISNSLIAAS